MRHSRTSTAGLAAVALLFAACSSSGTTPAPLATQPGSSPTSAVASISAAASTSAAAQVPPAPTNFTATRKSGSVPCPSADESCSETDLAWQSSADPGTGFRIYWTGTGEGPDATCLTVQAQATTRLDTKPAARSVQIFDPMAVGGGQICYWITAVNSTGESTQVPAASNNAGPTSPTAPSESPTYANAGTFSPTGSMASARDVHTATLLSDGRILIAGGSDGSKFVASAELFDPKTGKFSPTGPMRTARAMHTATLLPDGRVLIAGGSIPVGDSSGVVASAELYDPATGKFSPTGPMTTARELHIATALPDGRVLITGGTADGSTVLASAELYDPTTGKFSPTGPMGTALLDYTATALPDGRVLIAGGWDGSKRLASAEIYDPATGKFSPTGPMTTAREGQTATLLSGGRVLIAGGVDAGEVTVASTELYDPATGTFSPTGSLATARSGHSATALPDGRVLIAGGSPVDDSSGVVASAELYDPAAGKFSPTGPMTTAREAQTATLLSDGRVLIAGGYDGSKELASAELYQP